MALIRRQSVEFNLTEHCNLRCAGCDHSSPHNPTKFADLAGFRNDIEALSRVMRVDELKLLGGEPLLHPRLVDFLRAADQSELSGSLCLYTNGVLLHRAPREMWRLIDRLVVSVYPGITCKVGIEELTETAKSHDVILHWMEVPKFRLTAINTRNEDPESVRRIYGQCGLAHVYSCHTIYEGRYYKCTPAPFTAARLGLIGIPFENREDGVALHDRTRLSARLRRYIESDAPLAACSYCLGTSGKFFKHRQLDAAGLRKDSEADHSNVSALLARRPARMAQTVAQLLDERIRNSARKTSIGDRPPGPAL